MTHTATWPRSLALIPPPEITELVPPAVCDDQTDQSLTILGRFFLKVDGKLPTVTINGQPFDVTTVDGCTPLEAALRGAQEIGFTVLSISISLVAVFIPILLMGGLVGRLFREFAVTLSVAIGISLLVSLTTTPMMCAILLKPEPSRRHGRLYRMSERGFDGMVRWYDASLSWVLRHPRGVLVLTRLTVALNVYLFLIVPKGFFPQQDTGRLTGAIQAARLSFQAMQGFDRGFRHHQG